jgi:hypothetical protein
VNITYQDFVKQNFNSGIDEAMKRSNSNQSIVALSLGLSSQALNKRLNEDFFMILESGVQTAAKGFDCRL